MNWICFFPPVFRNGWNLANQGHWVRGGWDLVVPQFSFSITVIMPSAFYHLCFSDTPPQTTLGIGSRRHGLAGLRHPWELYLPVSHHINWSFFSWHDQPWTWNMRTAHGEIWGKESQICLCPERNRLSTHSAVTHSSQLCGFDLCRNRIHLAIIYI